MTKKEAPHNHIRTSLTKLQPKRKARCSDVISNKTGITMHSTPKTGQDYGCHLRDKRDHPVNSNKGRANKKSINRSSIREKSCSTNSSSMTKVNTKTRGPQSSLGEMPKSYDNVHQYVVKDDECQVPQSTTKLHPLGANNPKFKTVVDSSPPVPRGDGERPQNISPVAQRSPLVLTQDEASIPHQKIKSKGDHLSTHTLSVTKVSGASEINSKDKGKKSGEEEDKGGWNAPKIVNVPLRKKVHDDEIRRGDGVRRQERIVRRSTPLRSALTVEKLENEVTAKQLRSARVRFHQMESNEGGPPTRKPSARKPYSRPRHTVNTGGSETSGESNDGHEELMTAAKDAMNFGNACSSTFWRQLEPIFGLVSDKDVSYLKEQGDIGSSVVAPTPGPAWRDDSIPVINADGLTECGGDMGSNEAKSLGNLSEQLIPGTIVHDVPSVCQKVLGSLLSEEEIEGLFCNGDENFDCNGDKNFNSHTYGSRLEPDANMRYDGMDQHSIGNIQTVEGSTSNGYGLTATQSYMNEMKNTSKCADTMCDINAGNMTNYNHAFNNLPTDEGTLLTVPCTQYEQMSMDEKVLLELQIVGISPEPAPEFTQSDGEMIADGISKLKDTVHKQALKKKHLLSKLEKSVAKAKERQKRQLECRALDRLVWIAYDKYRVFRGRNASHWKGMSGKLVKRVAKMFIKRTLLRCKTFEETGKSCFNDPVFLNLFSSVCPLIKNAEPLASITGGQSSNQIQSSKIMVSGQDMDCRELLVDDVGGTVDTSLRAPSLIGSSLLSGAKGKRSERDRGGKNKREIQSRSGATKVGQPSLGNVEGGRTTKAKPKQKIGKGSEHPEAVLPSVPNSCEMMVNSEAKEKDGNCMDALHDSEAVDYSNLEELGIPDDFGEQGMDIGSWLNIDDDGIQDHDFVGLQIPMDDLADLDISF